MVTDVINIYFPVRYNKIAAYIHYNSLYRLFKRMAVNIAYIIT